MSTRSDALCRNLITKVAGTTPERYMTRRKNRIVQGFEANTKWRHLTDQPRSTPVARSEALPLSIHTRTGPMISQLDIEAISQIVQRMIGMAAFVFPGGGGKFGSVVLQAAMHAQVFRFREQMMFEKITGVFGRSRRVEGGNGEARSDIDGQVMIDRANAFEAAEQKRVLAPVMA